MWGLWRTKWHWEISLPTLKFSFQHHLSAVHTPITPFTIDSIYLIIAIPNTRLKGLPVQWYILRIWLCIILPCYKYTRMQLCTIAVFSLTECLIGSQMWIQTILELHYYFYYKSCTVYGVLPCPHRKGLSKTENNRKSLHYVTYHVLHILFNQHFWGVL